VHVMEPPHSNGAAGPAAHRQSSRLAQARLFIFQTGPSAPVRPLPGTYAHRRTALPPLPSNINAPPHYATTVQWTRASAAAAAAYGEDMAVASRSLPPLPARQFGTALDMRSPMPLIGGPVGALFARKTYEPAFRGQPLTNLWNAAMGRESANVCVDVARTHVVDDAMREDSVTAPAAVAPKPAAVEPEPAAVEPDWAPALFTSLQSRQLEVESLLRLELTSSAAIDTARRSISAAISFDEQLASLAASKGVSKGKLLQALLEALKAAGVDHAKLDSSGEKLMDGLCHTEYGMGVAEWAALAKQADEMRQLVRIKLADDNDLKTATSGLTLCQQFFADLARMAELRATSEHAVYSTLVAAPPLETLADSSTSAVEAANARVRERETEARAGARKLRAATKAGQAVSRTRNRSALAKLRAAAAGNSEQPDVVVVAPPFGDS